MYEDKHICTATGTKFQGLFINHNLPWKTQTKYITSKLGSACYSMQSIKPHVSINTLENDLLFLLPLCTDLWSIILGALLRQYKNLQVAKEDY